MKSKEIFKSTIMILGMALAVCLSGVVLGVGAGFLLSVLMRNQFSGWGGLVGVIFGILVFFPAGVALGLAIFKIRHYRGSLLLGIAGVALGEFLTVGLDHFFHARTSSGLLIPGFLMLIPLLGATGYHLGRIIKRGKN
jgi:hypothetical protein